MDWRIYQPIVDQWNAALVWLATLHSDAPVHFWTHMRSGVWLANLASFTAHEWHW